MCWVGISVWLRAGSSAPGTVPGRGWPQCSQSRDLVRTLVSGSEMRPRQPLVILPASFPQCMRAERPPSPAQRWDCRWAAVQENRFGGGSPVGGGWGPKQPTCLNWSGPPGQQVARARALPREQTWPGWGGALWLSPFSTPTKLGAPSMRLPHSSPQNTVHSTLPGLGDPDRPRSPSRLLCPHLSCSSSSSPGPYTPTLPDLPRRAPRSPARLGPTASSLSAQICPRLAAGPASLLTSPLCLPIPAPQPAACGP